jgi:hypothetical protein
MNDASAGEPEYRRFVLGKHKLSARGDDVYETVPVATRAVLRVERIPRKVWEPCAGRGAIVDELRAAGHEVCAQDLVDFGIPGQHARRDFLMELAAPAGFGADVMNPPYKLAQQFVEHALDLVPLVIVLLRLTFIEGMRRRDLLDSGHLARMHVFANRLPMMHRDGWQGTKASSAVPYCWFVFDRTYTGPTVIQRVTWRRS